MRPPFLTRARHAMKAAAMTFQGYGGAPGLGSGYMWPNWQSGSRTDWEGMAGDLWRNEVVSIALGWIGDNYCQPDFEVARKRGAVWEGIPDHRLTDLLRHPNPAYGASALWQAVATSEAVSGNGYLFKARSEPGWGRPLELWYLPHWQVIPQWDTEGRQFITHYLYRLPGRSDQRLNVTDVIHFRRGLNLYNQRSGEAPLGPMLRETVSDNEATGYVAAILSNSGVPNVAISADGPNVTIPDDEAKKLQEQFSQKFGGDNRGRALVCTRAMKIEPFQWSPEELALDKLPQRAEARLCAALRIPPMVVGLNVGDNQRTYANMGEARQMAYEDCLMPMQSRHCETLDMFLLPDLGDPKKERCRYNYENVRALQEDENDKSARAVSQFQAGVITRAQALGKIGMESGPEDEVYFVPKGGSLIHKDDAGATAVQAAMQMKQEQQQAALQGVQESQGDGAANGNGRNGNGNGRQPMGAG